MCGWMGGICELRVCMILHTIISKAGVRLIVHNLSWGHYNEGSKLGVKTNGQN